MKRTLNVLSLNDLIQLLYKFNNTKERGGQPFDRCK